VTTFCLENRIARKTFSAIRERCWRARRRRLSRGPGGRSRVRTGSPSRWRLRRSPLPTAAL